jgi:hypothetical protein
MAKQISEFTNKAVPETTDEVVIQETGGGTTKKATLTNILTNLLGTASTKNTGTTSDTVPLNGADASFDDIESTTGLLTLNGNATGGESITIADDAVGSITPPRTAGFAFVTRSGDAAPDPDLSALVWYDVGGSLEVIEISSGLGLGSKFDVSTSNVTGTTGADGNVTVAVQSGVIKIENRGTLSANFQVTFL